jgi:hypothetical protein
MVKMHPYNTCDLPSPLSAVRAKQQLLCLCVAFLTNHSDVLDS